MQDETKRKISTILKELQIQNYRPDYIRMLFGQLSLSFQLSLLLPFFSTLYITASQISPIYYFLSATLVVSSKKFMSYTLMHNHKNFVLFIADRDIELEEREHKKQIDDYIMLLFLYKKLDSYYLVSMVLFILAMTIAVVMTY